MNKLHIEISAKMSNDAFVRSTVAAFCVSLDPTVEQIEDIKTAVSEAFTNCVIHGYGEECGDNAAVTLDVCLNEGELSIMIADRGRGIPDIKEAMQPFYTTEPDKERSGMGFTLMKAFMDGIEVDSAVGVGTVVRMSKKISKEVAANA